MKLGQMSDKMANNLLPKSACYHLQPLRRFLGSKMPKIDQNRPNFMNDPIIFAFLKSTDLTWRIFSRDFLTQAFTTKAKKYTCCFFTITNSRRSAIVITCFKVWLTEFFFNHGERKESKFRHVRAFRSVVYRNFLQPWWKKSII